MDPISVTLSAGGRPFLTTRLRSVVFDNGAQVQRPERAEVGQTRPAANVSQSPQTQPAGSGPSLERSDGLGELAQRNLFQAKTTGAGAEAPEQRIPGGQPAEGAESADGLTEAQREQVDKLKARDAEVRRHEQAHAAVGGQYAGAPSYTYQQGPDGRRYAIGGEVKIDVAPVAGDPEATIEKMGVVKAAALAPAEPSSADRRVAALADAQRLQAVAELASLRSEERLEAFEEAQPQSQATPSDPSTDGKTPSTDNRFAQAVGILSRADDAQPGQKLNIAA